jgi:uncharacterized membrane protein YkoI
MLKRIDRAPGLLLTGLLLLLVQSGMNDALARGPVQTDQFQGRMIKVADRAVSMRDAINRVRQQTGGRVLDAQDGGDHYRVKVLTPEGVVRVYQVDARTGAIR